jgi:hypothetical protein
MSSESIIQTINKRIETEISYEAIDKLKDNNLINEYKKSKSVQNEVERLINLYEKHKIDDNTKILLINEELPYRIPPGTKGVIRGNKFNSIVKDTIENIKLDNDRFEVSFEKQCPANIISEIPDWYVLEKSTNKVIIGMNQLDLWQGGQQSNRGSKYLIDNKINTPKSKLLCVVCNEIKFSSNKNKAFKLFEHGYKNDTLCYLNNIENIINKFFN